jgi:hypothetical protein
MGFRILALNTLKPMRLSEQESRWLDRWEKRERLWLPVTRWICVLNGLLCLAAGAYSIHLLRKLSQNGISDLGPFGLIPYFFFGTAGLWGGFAISKWQGDIKLRLLLRLIREHEDTDS